MTHPPRLEHDIPLWPTLPPPGEELDALLAQVDRWAETEVRARRKAHGEDYDALLGPALDSLLWDLGLADLLTDPAAAPGADAAVWARVIEHVARADTGLGWALACSWAAWRTDPLFPRAQETGRTRETEETPSLEQGAEERSGARRDRSRALLRAWVLPGLGRPPGDAAGRTALCAPGAAGPEPPREPALDPPDAPAVTWGVFDGLQPQVVAEPQGDSVGSIALRTVGAPVRLTGPGAEAGEILVVAALRTVPGGEPDAASAVLARVSGNAPGLGDRTSVLRTGLAGCPTVDARVESLSVGPADWTAGAGSGPDGQAAPDALSAALAATRARLALGAAAAAVGALGAALPILMDWCASREIKGRGQPFLGNALVASVLGEVASAHRAAAALTGALAKSLVGLEPGTVETERARAGHVAALALAPRALGLASDGLDRAMELMASAGYATEWQLERYWRDLRSLAADLGLGPTGAAELAGHVFGASPR